MQQDEDYRCCCGDEPISTSRWNRRRQVAAEHSQEECDAAAWKKATRPSARSAIEAKPCASTTGSR